MTPEGRVKKMVTTYLDSLAENLALFHGVELYVSMFVPTGYGKRNTLDYTLCIFGKYVAIETKAPDEDLTPLQRLTARNIYRSGGKVFIISTPEGLASLRRWVEFQAEFE